MKIKPKINHVFINFMLYSLTYQSGGAREHVCAHEAPSMAVPYPKLWSNRQKIIGAMTLTMAIAYCLFLLSFFLLRFTLW